jgi:site-specific DNA-methyltransferase (adenine-specific)
MNKENMLTITNEDNMELMARYPDKYFDLAIVDPPYGIGAGVSKTGGASKHNSMSRLKANTHIYNDIKPNKEYFNELQRVSKNQIIWGGNYFINFLSSTRCFVVWDKMNYLPSMSQIEIAWTSFNKHSDLVKINSNYISQKWILQMDNKYAKENDKILDTHLGSGSIAIACHDYGFDLTACELDKEYFDKAMQRINNHTAQQKLF